MSFRGPGAPSCIQATTDANRALGRHPRLSEVMTRTGSGRDRPFEALRRRRVRAPRRGPGSRRGSWSRAEGRGARRFFFAAEADAGARRGGRRDRLARARARRRRARRRTRAAPREPNGEASPPVVAPPAGGAFFVEHPADLARADLFGQPAAPTPALAPGEAADPRHVGAFGDDRAGGARLAGDGDRAAAVRLDVGRGPRS